MNYTPKVKRVSLVGILIIVSALLCGCSKSDDGVKPSKDSGYYDGPTTPRGKQNAGDAKGVMKDK